MAISGGPDIVEDGLVLYLDTADPNSLPPGQSIKDLVTGTTFSGGSYSEADWANDISEITICLWWEKVGNSTGYSTWPVSKFNGSTDRASFVLYHFHNYNNNNQDGVMTWIANSGGTWRGIGSSYRVALNEKVMTVLQFNASKGGGQMWKNNTKIGSRGGGAYNLGITGSGYGGINFTGLGGGNATTHVYAVSFYDRELSDEEIVQNYNATKGRFGL